MCGGGSRKGEWTKAQKVKMFKCSVKTTLLVPLTVILKLALGWIGLDL